MRHINFDFVIFSTNLVKQLFVSYLFFRGLKKNVLSRRSETEEITMSLKVQYYHTNSGKTSQGDRALLLLVLLTIYYFFKFDVNVYTLGFYN